MKDFSPYVVLVILCAIAAALRVGAMVSLGDGAGGNPVDVYYVDREAASLILELRNPYLYSDYTNGLGQLVTFAYLPVIPLYFAPFVLAHLDIRYGSIAADLASVVSAYTIARSTLTRSFEGYLPLVVFSGAVAVAVFPVSVWFTSVSGTNVMIGSMFVLASLAALFEEKVVLSGALFGIAVASNQLVALIAPLYILYCLRGKNHRSVIMAALTSCIIIVPFLLYSPTSFLQDAVFFQLVRPLQYNGLWGLYFLVFAVTGLRLTTYVRVAAFLITSGSVTVRFTRTRVELMAAATFVLILAAFILPVDGFLNYYLPPSMLLCVLLPAIIQKVYAWRG